MELSIEKKIRAFSLLGKELKSVAESLEKGRNVGFDHSAAMELFLSAKDASNQNPWYTRQNVIMALYALGDMLEEGKLMLWIKSYPTLFSGNPEPLHEVAVIMAGNIPLVGFHDFCCVLMTGNRFLGKLSSNDLKLPVAAASLLVEIEPLFADRIRFSETPISGFDAVIATGSNNSARYFEHYFGKYPHIIRKNRNSVAVVNGKETSEELKLLGDDVFSFFGLGCRNVSKLMIPESFDIPRLEAAWSKWESIINHHKYFNNYEYFKAIYLVNRTPFFDTGYCLLQKDSSLASPVSVIHFETYPSPEWLEEYLTKELDNIQCIIGYPDPKVSKKVPFGKSQQPELWDYADGVDTMNFLISLS